MRILIIYSIWSTEIQNLLNTIQALFEDYCHFTVTQIHSDHILTTNLNEFDGFVFGPLIFGKWSSSMIRLIEKIPEKVKICPKVCFYVLLGLEKAEERMIKLYEGINHDLNLLLQLNPISIGIFEDYNITNKTEFQTFYLTDIAKEIGKNALNAEAVNFQAWQSFADWVVRLGEELQAYR